MRIGFGMKRLLRLLWRQVHERRLFFFYAHDPKLGSGQADPHVKVYASWVEIPGRFRKEAVPAPWLSPMRRRLRRGEARLLCYSEDGQKLDAYGWIQDWRPFRRRFGALAQTGTMLGPYWTVPAARGRGLYGRMLAHSLFLCSLDGPALIYTEPGNLASTRGIEKAGFRFLGEWEFQRWFGAWTRLRRMASSRSGMA
jgi:hypothetical protein